MRTFTWKDASNNYDMVYTSNAHGQRGKTYFIVRDAAGRIAIVRYPDESDADVPQNEIHYTYGGDGRVKQIAMVKTSSATDTTYGPERYVIQFFHDDVGRLVRKVVRDNSKQDTISTRYETKYEFDSLGTSL